MSAFDLIAIKLSRIKLWPCASPSYLSEQGTTGKSHGLTDNASLGWTDHPSIWRFRDRSKYDHRVPVAFSPVIPEPVVLYVILKDSEEVGLGISGIRTKCGS